jgi:hypothetical protein
MIGDDKERREFSPINSNGRGSFRGCFAMYSQPAFATKSKDEGGGMNENKIQNSEVREPGGKKEDKENLLTWFSALFILDSGFWLLLFLLHPSSLIPSMVLTQ